MWRVLISLCLTCHVQAQGGNLYDFIPSWLSNNNLANDQSGLYTLFTRPTSPSTTAPPRPTTTTPRPTTTTRHSYGCQHNQQTTCLPVEQDRYPTADGTCNNRLNTNKGKSNWPLKRLLSPEYKDGVSAPRVAKDRTELPTARMVRLVMADQRPAESSDISHMMPWWGQYIVHDMVNTPKIKNGDGTELDCDCDNPHPDCFNIKLDRTDIQRVTEGKKCLKFFRSKATEGVNCNSPYREHINSITSYIDAGTVYGNNQEQLDSLIDPESAIGELKVHHHHGHYSMSHLPTTDYLNSKYGNDIACKAIHKPANTPCLGAGDVRANENTGLTSLHTAFLRIHNKVIRNLQEINLHWNKEKLLKETRNILSAIHQIITYRTFLPVLIGTDYMKRFGLDLASNGHVFAYDASYDASVSDAFTTAAFRYGHVMLNKEMSRPSGNWYSADAGPIPLKDSLFNNDPLFNLSAGGMSSVMRGLTTDHSLVADTTMVDDMANFLFAEKGKFGHDLYATNIQRGRDHGMPGYNAYRDWCGLKKATTFNDLDEVEWRLKQKLQTLYQHVDDIDLFVGGLAETPVAGGAVGPTFACIIGYQFRDTKLGDRFWHENGGTHKIFSNAQLNALRKYTLSKFICETTQGTNSIQHDPMRVVNNHKNKRMDCSYFPELDLKPWKELKFHQDQPSVEFELTQWFPNNFASTCTLLRHLKTMRSDDVCGDVTSIETRQVGGNEQVRFQCPKGSIVGTDYPNHDSSTNVYWSKWLDESTPSYHGIEKENGIPDDCKYPIFIQAFTLDGIPARQTGDVFSSFSLSFGLVCDGKQQQRGTCKNYKIRYLCKNTGSTTTSGVKWSSWASTQNVIGEDTELLSSVKYWPGFCSNPLYMEARVVGTHLPVEETGDSLQVFDKDVGLMCRAIDQGISRSCSNYEVRYLCA